MDAVGNVFVTGESDGAGTQSDFATVKYDPSGNEEWVARHNDPENSFDRATDLAVDASGNVYVTGASFNTGWSLYTTVKYIQVPLTGLDESKDAPREFSLEQNYPNPFNASTTISFELEQQSHVTLAVYNLLGQRVAPLFEGGREAGPHKVIGDADGVPSGVYVARLTTELGERRETQMVLVK